MGDAAWPWEGVAGHAALGVFSLYLFSNDECEESGSQIGLSVRGDLCVPRVGFGCCFVVPLLLIMMRDFPHVLFLLSSKAPGPGPGSRAHFLSAERGWALGNPLWQESGAWDVKLCSSCWISPSPPPQLSWPQTLPVGPGLVWTPRTQHGGRLAPATSFLSWFPASPERIPCGVGVRVLCRCAFHSADMLVPCTSLWITVTPR